MEYIKWSFVLLANFLNKIDTACKPMDKNIQLPIEMGLKLCVCASKNVFTFFA